MERVYVYMYVSMCMHTLSILRYIMLRPGRAQMIVRRILNSFLAFFDFILLIAKSRTLTDQMCEFDVVRAIHARD